VSVRRPGPRRDGIPKKNFTNKIAANLRGFSDPEIYPV
jgi:hypothetical protein